MMSASLYNVLPFEIYTVLCKSYSHPVCFVSAVPNTFISQSFNKCFVFLLLNLNKELSV